MKWSKGAMLAAMLVCAGDAPAPALSEGASTHVRADLADTEATPGCAEEQTEIGTPEAADAVAGGKLLLSKRLKLIIRYHQVIPA